MGKKIIGIGLPKTGTSTLKKSLQILGFREMDDFLCGDYVHKIGWDADKYILTLRKSPDIWFDSVLRWAQKPEKRTGYFRKFRKQLYGAEVPDGNKETYINTYNAHIEKCKKYNPLVVCWEDGDGWEQLCDYLECDIPDIDFPHENKNTILS